MFQPRRLAFWAFVVMLLCGGAAVLADEYDGFAATAPAHLAVLPVWVAFVAAGVCLILLFDPFRSMRRHWPVLLAAAALCPRRSALRLHTLRESGFYVMDSVRKAQR